MEEKPKEKATPNESVRTSRAISEEVWNARPYTWWEPSDLTPVDEAYGGLAKSQVAFMRKLARQAPGWIMHRHAAPGAPHVWPEVRPEKPVSTGPADKHWHGEGEPPELPPGYRVLRHGSEAWKAHVRRINEASNEEDTEHELREDPHEHPNIAKYVFPSTARRDEEWWHDHSYERYADEEALRRHEEKWHKTPPQTRQDGKHLHIRRVKGDESLARRLDVHPMAMPRFADAERIYFVIEGVLKNDAVLSAIIREDRPESVFNVPSVSLWAADELDGFIHNLRGKQTVIVPDGDWYTKREVIAHARFAQRYLQHRGVDAVIAAPSQESGQKGVDDFLAAGHSLDELEVLDRAPSEMIEKAVNHRRGKVRTDALKNMARMIDDLAFFADGDGRVHVSHETMAKILGVARRTVQDNLAKMQDKLRH